MRNNQLPIIHAQLALSRNNPQTAIEILQRAKPYEMALNVSLASAFVRGNAYLAAHRTAEAAAEFQKILDHPGAVVMNPWGALAYLGLARSYALQGDSAKPKLLMMISSPSGKMPTLILLFSSRRSPSTPS